MFVDQFGNLLPEGTTLQVPSLVDHTGFVAYTQAGQQVMLHNSKKRRRAAMTTPEEFNDGNLPVVTVRFPQTPEEGALIVQRAWQDVQSGRRWTWFDNCQDFVSRALTGQNGSPTRNLLVGLFAVGFVFAVVVNSK